MATEIDEIDMGNKVVLAAMVRMQTCVADFRRPGIVGI